MQNFSQKKLIDDVICSRKSIRSFLSKEVSYEIIKEILEVASRAPSGSNTQPWKVYVLSKKNKEDLSKEIIKAYDDPNENEKFSEEYHYYPIKWETPYLERRRKVGWDLYNLLGLKRENKMGMHKQHSRNFSFFDAPVGLIFTIDRILEKGSWLDYGMFLQNFMIASKARGLDTCPQAAFNKFHEIIFKVLSLPKSEQLVCGMSLGFADQSKIENTLKTERSAVDHFTKFL